MASLRLSAARLASQSLRARPSPRPRFFSAAARAQDEPSPLDSLAKLIPSRPAASRPASSSQSPPGPTGSTGSGSSAASSPNSLSNQEMYGLISGIDADRQPAPAPLGGSSAADVAAALNMRTPAASITARRRPAPAAAAPARATAPSSASASAELASDGFFSEPTAPMPSEMTRQRSIEDNLTILRTDSTLGRSVPVRNGNGPPGSSIGAVTAAITSLNRICQSNAVAVTQRMQRFHERPGIKRKRLKMSRWRRNFKDRFSSQVQRLMYLKSKGW